MQLDQSETVSLLQNNDLPTGRFFCAVWVVVREVSQFMKIEQPHSILERDWTFTSVSDKTPSRRAYDVRKNVQRYRELVDQFGETDARGLMLHELKQDMKTYFGELSGVGYFAYCYRLNQSGTLVEDSPAQKPIREIMAAFPSVESEMWQEYMIPMLEFLPVEGSAFAMSVRKDDETIEGAHDYVYFFFKRDETSIEGVALELNLNKTQAVQILNQQIGYGYFDTKATWQEMRSQVFFYPAQKYSSPHEGLVDILQTGLEEMTPDELRDVDAFDKYVQEHQTKLASVEQQAYAQAEAVLTAIESQTSISQMERLMSAQELYILERDHPKLLAAAWDQGLDAIILPCGLVSLGSFGMLPVFEKYRLPDSPVLLTMGESVVSIMECVKCPFCQQTVDAIVTTSKIKCPECKAEVMKTTD